MEQNLQLLDPLVDMISFVGCIGSSSQIYDYFARHQIPAYLGSMEECLKKCWETKLPVVLSPGYASTDQYRNFEERGAFFKQLCREMDG